MTGRRAQPAQAPHNTTAVAIVVMIATFIIGAILVGWWQSRDAEQVAVPSAGNVSLSTPTPSTSTPVPTVTITESPAILVPDPVAVAQGIKPLRDLVAGDQVLYTAEPGGQSVLCTWNLWGGDIAISNITCGTETFDAPTGYLSPVAPR